MSTCHNFAIEMSIRYFWFLQEVRNPLKLYERFIWPDSRSQRHVFETSCHFFRQVQNGPIGLEIGWYLKVVIKFQLLMYEYFGWMWMLNVAYEIVGILYLTIF